MDVHEPLKYFDVYTKQLDEDARAGISHSSSKLQLVPKNGRHSSRQSSRSRINKGNSRRETHEAGQLTTSTAFNSPLRLTEDTLAQHTALLPDGRALPPRLKIQEPVRVPETMVANVPNGVLPISHLSRSTTSSSKSLNEPLPSPSHKYGKSGPSLPAILAVAPPFDIFAGPCSPVSAESLNNLAVSESQADMQPPALSTGISGHSSSPSPQGLTRRKGEPTTLHMRQDDAVDVPARPNMTTSSQTASSVSEINARCFARQTNPKHHYVKSEYSRILSIDDIVRKYQSSSPVLRNSGSASSPPVPVIPAKFRSETHRILSIHEIVSKHPPAQLPIRKAGQSAPLLISETRPRSRTTTEDSEISLGRSSIDSVTGEIMQSIKQYQCREDAKRLDHAKSQPSFSTPSPSRYRARQTSIFSDPPSESPSYSSTLPTSDSRCFRGTPTTDDDITKYIRSARLTRLLTLRRPPNHHLVVSFADVGCEDGHPVVVFLGLGSVRYLMSLYDDLAESLGLRLICIDRWGLGKTGDVPDSRRGFREWSTIVEEVLDQLSVNKFSIIAHSAGTPYALASSIHLESRVHGAIQLLAPWVGSASEATANAYRWLKFVPSGVIKTAQAAEWKVQGWRLGKNPKVQAQGVGFDPRAPLSSESTASSPVFAHFAATLTMHDPVDPHSRVASPSILSESEHNTGLDDDETIDTSFLSTLAQSRRRKLSLDTVDSRPSPHKSDATPSRLSRKISTSSRATSTVSPSFRSHLATPKLTTKLDLGTALMRASHAESLKGGTADLLTILQKTSKVSDFSFAEVARPVRVWHGLKDDKISLQNVLTLETLIPDCKVNVIPGADHSLMTNVPVFVQVLQAIAFEWDLSSRL